jgi:hypothetical protein
VTAVAENQQHAVVDDDAIRLYRGDLLIFLNGRNKAGKYGIWADHDNGLCPHEQVARYCDACKAGDDKESAE